MRVVHTVAEARALARETRARGGVVGLVPTMGALHRGHMSLIEAARECDLVMVSVFVNPLQFGPGEDYEQYPRTLEADVRASEEAGADVVFAPSAAEMYPEGASLARISVAKLGEGLCARTRPHFFGGVATVVAKLFNACDPDRAYFGEKDYQQLQVIRRMVADLNFAIDVVGCPMVREADGLAMSSRNAYLAAEERSQALTLSQGLRAAEEAFRAGERGGAALVGLVAESIARAPLGSIDYIEIVDAETLDAISEVKRDAVIALAVRFPSARLIDNVILRLNP